MNLISSLSRRYQLAKGRRKLRDLDREYSALEKRKAELESQGAATEKALLEKKLQLIGSIVFVWSRIEMRLSLIVRLLNVYGSPPRPPLPRELDRKLDYLKRHGKEWHVLHQHQDLLDSVIKKAHAEKTFRHNLVHGDYSLFDHTDEHAFSINLSKFKGADVEEVKTTYSGPQLLKRSMAVSHLSGEVDALLAAITESLVQLEDGSS